MTDAIVRRATGIAGVSIGGVSTLLVPLYFTYSGPPPPWTVLTRDLAGVVTGALVLLFFTGFCHVVRQTDGSSEWAVSIVYAAGVSYAVAVLVATSLEMGAMLDAEGTAVDPTIDGPLAKGAILLRGSITRMLTAVALAAAGYAVLASRAFPAWVGRAAYAIALFNLLFVPSVFWGTDPARFYSAIGWGNSALAAICLAYWMSAVGVALLRRPPTMR
jgi:hypothetical protein